VFFELSRADLFVMPSAADPFSLCKSANRAVLALANNVPWSPPISNPSSRCATS
jgi:hypothetical protein